MASQPNVVAISPVTSVFSSLDATFHVIENHWKVMLKRQGKYVTMICGIALALWIISLMLNLFLDLPPEQQFIYQIMISVLVGVMGMLSIGLLSMYLFLVNAAFTSKIIQGETVSYDQVLQEHGIHVGRKIVHVTVLLVYGSILTIIGVIAAVLALFLFLFFLLGVLSPPDFGLLAIAIAFIIMVVLYLVAPYPLMFAVVGTEPSISTWQMISRAFQLAKGNRVKIILAHVVMNFVIGFLSNIIQTIAVVVTFVVIIGSVFTLSPLLQALHVNLGILPVVFWIGLYLTISTALQVLLTTTFLGSFYGGLHGTIILKNQGRPFPWKQAPVPLVPVRGPPLGTYSLPSHQYPPPSASSFPKPSSDQSTSKTSKFCRYCGVEIPVDSIFCPNCGKNLT